MLTAFLASKVKRANKTFVIEVIKKSRIACEQCVEKCKIDLFYRLAQL